MYQKNAMKDKIDILKERFVAATNDKEREAIREEIRKLCDEDALAVAESAVESICETNARIAREG
jgi:hypothetical protein